MTKRTASATIFSLSGEPPAHFRAEPGDSTRFDAASLVSDEARVPCALRKLTTVGATLLVGCEIMEGVGLELELANGQRLAGTIAWSIDGAAGFLFEAPIDVIGTLARTLAALPAERRSVPRVELRQTICVRRGNQVEFTRSRNLSQGGAGIETQIALQSGDRVQINFDGLKPLDGVVRWCRGSQAGIAFEEDLPWQVLMPWLRHVQQTPPHPVRAAVIGEPSGLIPDQRAIRLDAPARVREGSRWWNVRIRAITPMLVEFETAATFATGSQLWVSLPGMGGAPATVIETDRNRVLCEFRLALRDRDLGLIASR